MSQVYGYVRVSSRDQNEARQIIAMQELHVPEDHIFIDKQSGKDFNRRQYQRMLKKLKPEDLVYVKSIDRLGRNYEEIIEQWKIITKSKKADICIIEMPLLDTRNGKDLMGTFLSDIVLALLSYVAQNERETIRRRQAEGIAAAKARGVKFGRREKDLPENFAEIRDQWFAKEINLEKAGELSGMSASTFYRKARKSRPEDSLKEEQTLS